MAINKAHIQGRIREIRQVLRDLEDATANLDLDRFRQDEHKTKATADNLIMARNMLTAAARVVGQFPQRGGRADA